MTIMPSGNICAKSNIPLTYLMIFPILRPEKGDTALFYIKLKGWQIPGRSFRS
jgi:hypothetical protein